MTNFDPELSIRVRGKELIVTLQGSNYAVTYFKALTLGQRRSFPSLRIGSARRIARYFRKTSRIKHDH